MSKDQDEDEESVKETKKEQPNVYKEKSEMDANRTENLKMRKLSRESNAKKCQRYDLKKHVRYENRVTELYKEMFLWSGGVQNQIRID